MKHATYPLLAMARDDDGEGAKLQEGEREIACESTLVELTPHTPQRQPHNYPNARARLRLLFRGKIEAGGAQVRTM